MFRLNSLSGVRGDVENRFWWPFWISDRHTFNYFQSRDHLVAQCKFHSNRPTVLKKSEIDF